MTTRASVTSIAPWVGVAVALLFALHDRFDLVENRVLILIGLAVAAAGIVRRLRDARTSEAHSADARTLRRRTLIAVAVLGLASLALVLARAITSPRLGLRDDVLAALVPPLLGWSVFLLMPIGLAPHPAPAPAAPAVSRRALVLLAGATFLAVWLATAARTHADNIDEVLYLFQAHRFAIGNATWALEPALQRFVKLPLMVVTPEGVYTQYPPGYPAILALFVRFGAPSLCGAVLGTLAVLTTQRLGARVANASAGLLAAALLATNAIFLRWSAVYMSHVAALTALCTAAWLLLDATERADRRRDWESVLGGMLLGIAFAVRPVTALAVGLSIWLSLLVRRLGWPRLRRVTAMLCVGAALPFAALLAYNAATNGDPLRLGYQAAQDHYNDVGFGPRGFVLYDRDVRPVLAATEFTLRDAVRNELAFAAWPFARDLFPVWWLLPLMAIAFAYRMRVRWPVVAAFTVLPIINFFFYWNGERLYVELLPFALVGAALVVHRVQQVDPRAARALVILLVGANVVTSAARIAGDSWQREQRPADVELLARALRDSSEARPGVLVFVRNPPLSEPLLIGLTQFNFGRFPGPVVVARDLGAENAQLACRLPGYRTLLAETDTTARVARLHSLGDSTLATPRCDRPTLLPLKRPDA
jgi:4-amino-4-deoxy-L-arabinose transferase-like glycosyltransferase